MKIGPIKAAELAADYYEKDAPVLRIAFKYGICQRTLYSTLRHYGYLAPADDVCGDRRRYNGPRLKKQADTTC